MKNLTWARRQLIVQRKVTAAAHKGGKGCKERAIVQRSRFKTIPENLLQCVVEILNAVPLTNERAVYVHRSDQ